MCYTQETHIQMQIEMLCGQYGTGFQKGRAFIAQIQVCETIMLNTAEETKAKVFQTELLSTWMRFMKTSG